MFGQALSRLRERAGRRQKRKTALQSCTGTLALCAYAGVCASYVDMRVLIEHEESGACIRAKNVSQTTRRLAAATCIKYTAACHCKN